MAAGIDPTDQLLNWDHYQSAFSVFGQCDIHGVAWSQINLLHQHSRKCYLAVGVDLEWTMRRLHPHQTTASLESMKFGRFHSIVSRVLTKLIIEATSLDVSRRMWLLEAAALSEAIYDAVLGDPHELDKVQRAVREAADRAGCDLIVGACPSADRVVRDLNVEGPEPAKALLFELVRVTGATLARAERKLKYLNVVSAVFVDVNPASRPNNVLVLGTVGSNELIGS